MMCRLLLVSFFAAPLAVCGAVLPAQAPSQQVAPSGGKYALLIGIDTYEPLNSAVTKPADAPAEGRFAGGISFENLKGPRFDVAAMRDLLISEKFGFDSGHVDILLDDGPQHAVPTRANVEAALRRDLVTSRKSGDTILLYVSGHGSLRLNSKGDGQAYDLDGTGQHAVPVENTIVMADAYLGQDDITNRFLRRLFNEAADHGVHVIAIFDTCHSGGQARGALDPHLVARRLPYDPRDLDLPPDKDKAGALVPAPASRADNSVLILSAAQKDQLAQEIRSAAPPYGLFTHALIETLQALPAKTSVDDLFKSLTVDMERTPDSANQQPALDATVTRRKQTLLGGDPETDGDLHAAAVVNDDGTYSLDVGYVEDVGTDSLFTQATGVNGPRAVLRVVAEDGIARTKAALDSTSPPNAKIRTGDIFTRTGWVPPKRPPLYFHPGPTNLSSEDIQAALEVVRQSKATLVDDPSYDHWDYILLWSGSSWVLRENRGLTKARETDLGLQLTTGKLAPYLVSGKVLWFDAPLSKESAHLLMDPNVNATLNPTRDQALYVIAGTVGPKGISYAWYYREGFDAAEVTPAGLGRGCSADSHYPLRTEWVTAGLSTPDVSPALNKSAVDLAKLHSWFELPSNSTASAFPYSLALQRILDAGPPQTVPANSETHAEERFSLALIGSVDAIVKYPRWVYVLGIDCQGNGQLLWPAYGEGGRYPTDSGRLASIPLPGLTFRITPPYGTDTYILLTTGSPLPQPDVLNFDGVVRGGTRGADNPLENLLRSASSGMRGNTPIIPTDWSVQVIQMHSRPQAAPPN